MKISNINKIKKESDLKKYSLNKPIHMNNYLWHYLALYGNLEGFKLLKNKDILFGLPDQDGNNPLHLSAKMGHHKLLTYLLKTYPEYILNKNNDNKNFMHYLVEKENTFMKFFSQIKDNLKVDELMKNRDDEDFSVSMLAYSTFSYKSIKNLLETKPDLVKYPKIYPSLFFLFKNDSLDQSQILNFFKILNKNKINLDIRDHRGENSILYAIQYNNIELLKYLIKKKINFSYMTPIDTIEAFRLAYKIEVNSPYKNNYKMSKLLWNTGKIDPNQIDKYGDNLAHYMLQWRLKKNVGSKELEYEIFPLINNWKFPNIDDNTPFHLLLKLKNKNEYLNLLKNKEIDINKKNKFGENIKNMIDKETLRKNKIKITESKDKIKVKKYKYSHFNLFKARFSDIILYSIILNKKYPNLFFPILKESFKIPDFPYLNSIMINNTNNHFSKKFPFPWIIYWENSDKYYVHEELTNLINKYKKNEKYEFGVIFVSVTIPQGGLHATILLIDFLNNTIERFDPYGNTSLIDQGVDETLEEELTWNTGLKYLKPENIMGVSSYQSLSRETDPYQQKSGDFGGYCLAWCLWYIENRIANKKISPKKLIEETLFTLVNKKESLMEYIRNYANSINKKRENLMISMKIPKKMVSNEILSNKYQKLLVDGIKKYYNN